MKTEKDYALVIGGANIDIFGFPYSILIPQDSNIGKVKMSLGGVGRNIGENLVRLGVNTKFMSILGDDLYGKKILEESEKIGLDMSPSKIIKETSTSTYLAILDENQDMAVAISSMDIYDKMTVSQIEDNRKLIQNSSMCIIDTNIPEEVIIYLLENYKNKVFFVDTVSTAKALKIKNRLDKIHTLKTNKLEVEAITGLKIENVDDMVKSWKNLNKQGLKRIFITLGSEGIFFADESMMGLYKAENITPENTTGAGDAFTAALAYCFLNNFDIKKSAGVATAASIIALSHQETINPEISAEKIESKIKEIKLCMKNI